MAVPEGLSFAFFGQYSGQDDPLSPPTVAYLVAEGFDPTIDPGVDFVVAVECDLALGSGFDYYSTPGDGQLDDPAAGSYLIYLWAGDTSVLDDYTSIVAEYGWNPFDHAVVGDYPTELGGVDDYDLSPGLHPSSYDPAGVTAPSYQDCPISAASLADGTLRQRFDTRAFPDLGDRLTGTLDDGVQSPEAAVPTVPA